jgi:hypothetical protein
MARFALGAAIVALVLPAVSEAKEDPITQLQRTQQQLKDLLVPGPHGWQMIRDIDAYRRLTRRVVQLKRMMRPVHYSGWVCIHRQEGAWNSNTGNGFYGGLQMHKGWGGVLYAHLLSPIAQIRLAEDGYRRSGYSHSWLAGQWPNTYPPCAGHF